MEEVILKAVAADIGTETVSLGVDKEGICIENGLSSPKEKSPDKNGSEVSVNNIVNGYTSSECEIQKTNETPKEEDNQVQKTLSPTLIESAFKVMKNLFSPDKTKNKPPSVFNPINQPKSGSGSPRSSLYIPGNPEILSTDSETDTQNKIELDRGESLKIPTVNIEFGTPQSPLPLDLLNNTNDSFSTTVSLIDESFHSAVTHLDEQGDVFKNGANIMDNILNSSQNLDLIDPYNDTLEANDSCLGNTTVRAGGLSPEGPKLSDFLEKCRNGSFEEINAICSNESGKVSPKLITNGEIAVPKSPINGSSSPVMNGNEENKTLHLFLNKSFGDPTPSENGPIDPDKANGTDVDKTDDKQTVNLACREVLNNNEKQSPGPTISSTTVVLSTADSADLENMLVSLKADDSETNTSSLTSLDSVEVALDKSLLRAHDSPFSKTSTDNNIPLVKEKSCASEGNSPINKSHCSKMKLYKSDEFISLKSPEPNLNPREKNNSVDVSFIRNSEASATEKKSPLGKMHSTPKTTEFDKNETCVLFNSQTLHQQSPKPHELNITFDTNAEKTFTKTDSIELGTGNETFTKSLNQSQANQTFDIPDCPNSGSLNKTYDTHVCNITFDNTNTVGTTKLNQTFDKPDLNTTMVLNNNKTNETFVKEIEKQESGPPELKEVDVRKENDPVEDPTPKQETPETKMSVSPSSEAIELNPPYSHKFQKNSELNINRDPNDSFISIRSSNTSLISGDFGGVLSGEELPGNQSIDDLSGKLEKLALNDSLKQTSESRENACSPLFPENGTASDQTEEKLLTSLKDNKMGCDPDLVQLIQEQFSSNDIEKICSVVHDLSSAKLSSEILKASEQFDKSFHASFSDADFKQPELVLKNEPDSDFKQPELVLKNEPIINPLSPQSLDFLTSIRGKPTGRDLSRESLYVKFDPLVQPAANSLIDFTKEAEALPSIDASPVNSLSTSICEQLLAISPQTKPDEIVPPLTPLSHKTKAEVSPDKTERLKELQNEIYFLKNLYNEREKANKAKMDEFESQIAKLTGESCMLEDKLKESSEREKSLVKKIKEQNQSIGQLNVIMEEYVKVISKLTEELETLKAENQKQIETLSNEKDSYMTHLQNTEAAFSDVHVKYEKSKKTIASLRANEMQYKEAIADQSRKIQDFKAKAKEAQDKSLAEFQKLEDELNEAKTSHSQETARLRAQLKKTELKVAALQESLDQKIKENQQLTAICDELIEGKK